ncbi:MAG TPA: hypothetical protein DCR03_04255 [Gammaproteobacteria bacterium]|jgi:hypothetical protein|nr:hypothetical protein [Gammaproteobacteria bacterium]|tara:strand:+ start:271 stop:651 length:381 start_codon:yes stop_codon:yes gene_type:complete
MKKMLLVGLVGLLSTNVLAGPTIETYICTLNEGKTLEDVNAMVATFSSMIKKAGLQDSYTAHVGFQQIPAKANSVNWIGISPTPTDYGKAIEWFTNTKDGQKFGALYQSVYTCETSFMTFVTASSS